MKKFDTDYYSDWHMRQFLKLKLEKFGLNFQVEVSISKWCQPSGSGHCGNQMN